MARLLLFLAFLGFPVLEIWLLFQAAQVIGAWQTVAVLIAGTVLGSWLVRREGRRAWAALQGSMGSGRLPDRELADSAMVMAGGVLLITPGLITDVAGLFFVLPFTRPLARRWLGWLLARRVRAMADRSPYGPLLDARGPLAADEPSPGSGRVVPGEVIGEVTEVTVERVDRPARRP